MEYPYFQIDALQWHQSGRDGISNHQSHHCLFNCLFRRRSKKTSKLRVTGLCAGNSTVTGEFPAQMASNVENFSIWWRHHGFDKWWYFTVFLCCLYIACICTWNVWKCTNNTINTLEFVTLRHNTYGIYAAINQATLGSDKDPINIKPYIWTNALLLLIRPVRTALNEIWIEINNIQIYKEMYLKMQSTLPWPFHFIYDMLNHWGRIMYICIIELGRHWFKLRLVACLASTLNLTSADLMLIGPLETNFSKILISIQAFLLKKKCICKMSALLS